MRHFLIRPLLFTHFHYFLLLRLFVYVGFIGQTHMYGRQLFVHVPGRSY